MPPQLFALQPPAQLGYPFHRIQHVPNTRIITIKRRIRHTGTASLQTRCAKPRDCGRIRDATRSTLLPSSFSYADDIARSLRQLYSPGIHFTRKSTSLSERSALRAHEPKTQSFSALCLLAIAYISSRFARISSSMHMFSSFYGQDEIIIPHHGSRDKGETEKNRKRFSHHPTFPKPAKLVHFLNPTLTNLRYNMGVPQRRLS